MYEIIVSDNTSTLVGDASSTINSHLCGSWCNHWTTWYYPTTFTKYLYQIICPHKGCKTSNWLELDTIKDCSKCGSTLKAVRKVADYEVEINDG